MSLLCPLIWCVLFATSIIMSGEGRSLFEDFQDSNEITTYSGSLPKCSIDQDTYGEWRSMSLEQFRSNHTERVSLQQHFHGGGPGEAIHYSSIWLPHNCSYHRFTSSSIHVCTKYTLDALVSSPSTKSNVPSKKLHIYFYGDSALRGIINDDRSLMVDEGLLRVLAGSEVFGPCLNKICGFADIAPPWQENLLQHNHVEFKDLIISFVYIKSLTDAQTRADIASTLVDTAASRKSSILYAVVLNTGAWDFDFIARKHKGTIAADECNTKETMNISRSRVSPAINESMWELSREASLLNIRLVYRNNHHNARFGTRCADDDFQLMLRGSAWEIWDNRRLSDGIWMKQVWDGFHFDRHEINLVIDHKAQRDFYILQRYEAPGQLELQLAQSLLQLLFHGCLRDDRFESIIREDPLSHEVDKGSSNTSLEDIWRTRFSSAKQHGYWDPTKITQNVYANSWIKNHWVRNSIGQ